KVVPANSVVNRQAVSETKTILHVERVAALIHVTMGIAYGLTGVIDGSTKKIGQSIEAQLASVIEIEKFVNASPTPLESIFPIVLTAVVGKVREELVVGIDTAAGIGFVRSQTCEGSYANNRQPKVLRITGRVQAQTGRIKVNVLRSEGFRKAVPPRAKFNQ